LVNAEKLKNEFEKQAQEKYSAGDYTLGKLDVQGQRINIEILIERESKDAASFISGWMVRKKGFITNNTPLGGR
jgi:anti-sigma-K factor RskA